MPLPFKKVVHLRRLALRSFDNDCEMQKNCLLLQYVSINSRSLLCTITKRL